MAGDEGKTGLVILLEVWCFLPLRGGQEEELDALRFSSKSFFSEVVDRTCELFPKMSHHEEKGTTFCSHSGLLVPYDVAEGSISQISVKFIIKLQYPHKCIYSRC